MATARDFRKMAMDLEGTTEAPHFDRTAFKVARIYATLAPDKRSANFWFTPNEQALMMALHPGQFTPVPGKWGEKGATTAQLADLDLTTLTTALKIAWQNAQPRPRQRR